jgi:hypothetical protein
MYDDVARLMSLRGGGGGGGVGVGVFCSITDSKSLPNGSRFGVTIRSRAFCTHFAKHLVNSKDEQMLRTSVVPET